ncbi:DNA circularization N-terminal domain-containing protein [Acetobacter sp. P1H12_c]|uniref:DNA circularization N-terminal domain-containing protein n=1 Tax=Acetobacter sp. P1H12_c TaxID=2762621 RepID=UPI001C03EF9B|nr:DNA circularization N-terminal domain-containing protein [Acetobacter sp. P1H12_c]
MSGALSGLTSLSGLGAGSLGSQTGALGGLLGGAVGGAMSVAAWRGVTFWMPSSQDEAGRRMLQIWFPGRDDFRTQDFGAQDGPIRVSGLIIGDDYVIRAKRMRTALMQAGNGTLVHPWWGAIKCRLVQSGSISFSDGEIRLARFQATFVRVPPDPTSKGLFARIADTLTSVLTQADALVDSAVMAMRSVLSVLTLPLALVSAVSNVVSVAHGVWDAVTGSTAALPVRTAASAPLAALAGGVSVPATNSDTTYADSVATLLAGVPAAVAQSVSPTASAAIAPADAVSGVDEDDIDPAVATTLLITAVQSLRTAGQTAAEQAADPASVRGLMLGATLLTAAQAVAAASSLTYASQDDALSWRDRLLAMLDDLIDDIETLAGTNGAAVPISGMLGALRDSKAAITADISERLGRLPAVIAVPVPRQMSAWLVAYAVAGDVPANVEAVWTDMVQRNGLRLPAVSGPGTVRVLKPEDAA